MQSSGTPRRVLILFQDPLLRDIMERLCVTSGEVTLVGAFPRCTAQLDDLLACRPEVVILDRGSRAESLPAPVAALLTSLLERCPGLRGIMVSLADGRASVFSGWQTTDLSVEKLLSYVRNPVAQPERRAAYPPVHPVVLEPCVAEMAAR